MWRHCYVCPVEDCKWHDEDSTLYVDGPRCPVHDEVKYLGQQFVDPDTFEVICPAQEQDVIEQRRGVF